MNNSSCASYLMCLLVDGACVITELDWGEGRACWITTLLSWLPILEWDCWCCMEMFCEQRKTLDKEKETQTESEIRGFVRVQNCRLLLNVPLALSLPSRQQQITGNKRVLVMRKYVSCHQTRVLSGACE